MNSTGLFKFLKSFLIFVATSFFLSSQAFGQLLTKCDQTNVQCSPEFIDQLRAQSVVMLDFFHFSQATAVVVAHAPTWKHISTCDEENPRHYIYILTAFHNIDLMPPISGDNIIGETEKSRGIIFNYKVDNCSSPDLPENAFLKWPTQIPHNSNKQHEFLAHSDKNQHDIVLFKVDITDYPNLGKIFASVVMPLPIMYENAVMIHHPNSRVKKINWVDKILVPAPSIPFPSSQTTPEDWIYVEKWVPGGHSEHGTSGSPLFLPFEPRILGVATFLKNVDEDTTGVECEPGYTFFNHISSFWNKPLEPHAKSLSQLLNPENIQSFYGYHYNDLLLSHDAILNMDVFNTLRDVLIQAYLVIKARNVTIRSRQVAFNKDADSKQALKTGTKQQSQSWPLLRIIERSNVAINTRRLDLPSMEVAPPYPPGNEGWDGSRVSIEACEVEPIDQWVINQDAEVNLRAECRNLELGLPVQYPQEREALIFDPATKITLKARENIIINHSLVGRGWITPWDEDGYLKLITDNDILINPLSLVNFDVQLYSDALFSSADLMMENFDVIMHGVSWRVSADRITAEQMHFYNDIYEDWQPEDGIIMVSNQATINRSTFDHSTGDLDIHVHDLEFCNSTINVNSGTSTSIWGRKMTATKAVIRHLVDGDALEWRLNTPSDVKDMVIKVKVPGPRSQNPIHTQTQKPGTLSSPDEKQDNTTQYANTDSPSLEIFAAEMNLGMNHFIAEHGSILIQTAKMRTNSNLNINSSENGRIEIKAMDEQQLQTHQTTVKTQINNMITRHVPPKKEKPQKVKTAKVVDSTENPAVHTIKSDSTKWITSDRNRFKNSPEKLTIQAFPNPFNHQTKIRYHLPANRKVEIKIYDLLGRLIATPFQGQQSAGNHTVRWSGRNCSSGIYHAVITAISPQNGEYERNIVKLVLIK